MKSSWVRRPVMFIGVVLMALGLTLTSPVWVIATVLVDAARGRWRFPISRFIVFGTLWAWLEVCGVLVAMFLFCAGRSRDVNAHYALQKWWTRSIIQALGFTVGLQITVEGADNLGPGPFIVLCRHASLADSIMSAWVLATHASLRPRYVLKKELKIDPCLDILGHRLPNYFVDRESSNVAGELQGIEQMALGLSVGDAAVIFPEGSRASAKKRTRALEKLQERSPSRAERLSGLQYLIAPKPAGASALLTAVPQAHVLTMWHSGFDGLDTFSGVLRHLGNTKARVFVRVEEHARESIPAGDEFVIWLDEQWAKMDRSVAAQLLKENERSGETKHG